MQLFAPGLPQNGFEECYEEISIEGFFISDIQKEVRRVKRLRCEYCHLKGANLGNGISLILNMTLKKTLLLGCCNSKCPKAYHTTCGVKNKVLFEFTSKFESFCRKHKKIFQKDKKNLDNECGICYEQLTKGYPNAILIPCCKNSWFHKKCLQKYSLSSGVHFKCPMCGDKNCQERLKEMGIFFPHRDASWELEENAFEELYRPIIFSCDYPQCKDPTKYSGGNINFKFCYFCGSKGIHYQCFSGNPNEAFTCTGCKEILKNVKKVSVPKPKSFAAILLGESDCSSDEDEIYNEIIL